MYAKETQTDAVSVRDKVSEDEEEGEELTEPTSTEPSTQFQDMHKDDTIEPEKQVGR